MKKIIITLLIVPLFLGFSENAVKVKFFKGSLNVAKERAANEGKLYFVEFMARWCMPCRWMDETTFTDPTLVAYIQDNYVPVKVDIDDFDGFAYKQMYNIKMLPSILVFNSKGDLLAQYEESMAPSKLLEILRSHDKPENRTRSLSQGLAQEERPSVNSNLQSDVPESYDDAPQQPTIKPAPSRPDRVSLTNPKPQPTKPTKVKPQARPTKPAATKPVKVEKPLPVKKLMPGLEEGLYRFKVSRQSSRGFSVQIGAFREYGNVLREAAKLEGMFKQPIIVHIATYKGQPVYKILVGEFGDRQNAIQFRDQMSTEYVKGIIKDLTTIG